MVQTRVRAAVGTIAFFLLAPGGTAGLVPWLITQWRGDAAPWARVTGAVFVVAGTLLVIAAFTQFVLEGRGTPAPVAPTQELVIGGLYRWVRNPMYLGVSTAIAGQAVMFGSVGVGVWLAVFVLATTTFTLVYEEPTLRRTYGASYDAYAAAVPRWRPRLTPWRPEEST
jgi:protein-S-isoprenylcysteine O-methyltransferase Ste14